MASREMPDLSAMSSEWSKERVDVGDDADGGVGLVALLCMMTTGTHAQRPRGPCSGRAAMPQTSLTMRAPCPSAQ